jgi:hypothetical protein
LPLLYFSLARSLQHLEIRPATTMVDVLILPLAGI